MHASVQTPAPAPATTSGTPHQDRHPSQGDAAPAVPDSREATSAAPPDDVAAPTAGFARYRYLVLSDLHRTGGRTDAAAFLRELITGGAFRYNVWMRTCEYARTTPWLRYTVYPLAWIMHRRLSWKLGISIPPSTRIGPGFYIGHFGGIIVNHKSVIGKNCNISQGVTIGKANRGRNKGYPTLGDNVFIGPGAVIVGNVRVGNNVAIGANSVVTRDVPDNAVVAGVPGRVVSLAGAADYVNRTDYDAKLLGRPD